SRREPSTPHIPTTRASRARLHSRTKQSAFGGHRPTLEPIGAHRARPFRNLCRTGSIAARQCPRKAGQGTPPSSLASPWESARKPATSRHSRSAPVARGRIGRPLPDRDGQTTRRKHPAAFAVHTLALAPGPHSRDGRVGGSHPVPHPRDGRVGGSHP